MENFDEKLMKFLHDPIDKCFDIRTHERRAREYAEILGISNFDEKRGEIKGSDEIASCMERSVLPKVEKYGLKEEDLYQSFNEIRHPLSQGKLNVCSFDMKKEEIFKKIKEKFISIRNQLPSESKWKFFYLWRNLPDLIYEEFKNSLLGKFIPILPADTRIPDHSIWEHIKIASAVNGLWDKENKMLLQNNSLFLFTIGPVQSFISQARKTQDLFMGSFILSYLTFKAIEVVVKKIGPTNLIYPDLYGQPLMDWFLRNREKINLVNSFENYIDQPTIPNRFVAFLPTTDKVTIENFAKEVEKAVVEEWHRMVTKTLEKFGIKLGKNFINKQSMNFPEIYWAAIPLRKGNKDVNIKDFSEFFEKEEIKRWESLYNFLTWKDEKGNKYYPNIGVFYQLAYSTLEKSIGARKNLRDFKQKDEEGKKCHLCGEQEGIIKEGMGNLKVGKYISPTEGLCVKCFTKRGLDKYLGEIFGKKFKNFSFPSLAEIACSDFKERAINKARNEFIEYIEMFKKLLKEFEPIPFLPKLEKDYKKIIEENNIKNVDGMWFFEENLRVENLEEQFGIKPQKEELANLRKKIEKLTKTVGAPSSYYAVIMLDGDFMGEWLSGKRLPSLQNAYNSEIWRKIPQNFKNELTKNSFMDKKVLTPAIHAAISHAIRNYSIEIVRKVVEEEHLGKLIYSGGDDVLAFVNLKDLFEVIRKLRAGFSGHIKINEKGNIIVDWENVTGFVEKNGKYFLTMGPESSVSCGVVIAHYKIPLKLVIEKVREAEKEAKKMSGKDAFTIVLMKHSGELRKCTCNWIIRDKKFDVVEKIGNIVKYFTGKNEKNITLSRTFPYKLNRELARLKEKNGAVSVSSDILRTEMQRILKRSIEVRNEEEKRKKEKIVEELTELLSDLLWISGIGGNLTQFINLLEITSFISTEEKENVFKS